MKKLIYFIEFIFINIFFFFFKLLGYKISSNLGFLIGRLFGPIFRSKSLIVENLKKNFLFFCGLGNPSEFERTLKKYNFKIKEKFVYPDHYNFSNSDILNLKKLAKKKKLNIITTEKDYLRLSKKHRKNIKFLKIDLNIKNLKNFSKFLIERLWKN